MCATVSHRPPECITFRTIRKALAECESSSGDHHGFRDEARLAYVVAKLRAASNEDCTKAADFLLAIFRGRCSL